LWDFAGQQVSIVMYIHYLKHMVIGQCHVLLGELLLTYENIVLR